MVVTDWARSKRRRAMSSTVVNVRAWGIARPRLTRPAGQIRSARNLSVEQVARMVPEWGRLEVRYAGDDRPWITRDL
jgi:hypothetical protein